jgi:hypothetical protein
VRNDPSSRGCHRHPTRHQTSKWASEGSCRQDSLFACGSLPRSVTTKPWCGSIRSAPVPASRTFNHFDGCDLGGVDSWRSVHGFSPFVMCHQSGPFLDSKLPHFNSRRRFQQLLTLGSQRRGRAISSPRYHVKQPLWYFEYWEISTKRNSTKRRNPVRGTTQMSDQYAGEFLPSGAQI